MTRDALLAQYESTKKREKPRNITSLNDLSQSPEPNPTDSRFKQSQTSLSRSKVKSGIQTYSEALASYFKFNKKPSETTANTTASALKASQSKNKRQSSSTDPPLQTQ